MKTSILFVLTCLLSVNAHAYWPANLQSSNGTKIQIEYQHSQVTGGAALEAYPVFVHVTLPQGLACDTPVHIVLITYQPYASSPMPIQELELTRIGGNCSFMNNEAARLLLADEGGNYHHQIAIRIGDEWLTDPVNGTHNFNFTLW